MLKTSKIFTCASLIFLGFLLHSCGDKSSDPMGATDAKSTAENQNEQKFNRFDERDAKYVVDIYSVGLYQVEFAKYAKSKTSKHEVMDLANAIISAHTGINMALNELADKKQITLPEYLDQSKIDEIHATGEKHIEDFDRFFADKLVDDHKKEIELFQKASFEGNDIEISNFLTSAQLTLREQLTIAMETREHLK